MKALWKGANRKPGVVLNTGSSAAGLQSKEIFHLHSKKVLTVRVLIQAMFCEESKHCLQAFHVLINILHVFWVHGSSHLLAPLENASWSIGQNNIEKPSSKITPQFFGNGPQGFCNQACSGWKASKSFRGRTVDGNMRIARKNMV
ncbi:hypothetical protein GOP47_0008705 [Adiantum capillus-veneris]|uniref:Uncharacterized protein n=1 Tax=Adiantum capillus-veneris TaxID=13818 RepID=A0A9D4UZH4_ADICA|nr:hypothetical protein GOP47_0008705 [Adiantum capillus-veneris]